CASYGSSPGYFDVW
nr:immunoglobulin heavy chain junction region [Mus musculus]